MAMEAAPPRIFVFVPHHIHQVRHPDHNVMIDMRGQTTRTKSFTVVHQIRRLTGMLVQRVVHSPEGKKKDSTMEVERLGLARTSNQPWKQ